MDDWAIVFRSHGRSRLSTRQLQDLHGLSSSTGSASMGIVWKKPAHLGSMGRLPPSAGCDRQPQAELFLEGVQLVRELAWLHTPLRERKLSRAGRGSCKDKWLSLAGSQNASLLSKEEPGLGKTQCPRFSHPSEKEKHLPGVTQ